MPGLSSGSWRSGAYEGRWSGLLYLVGRRRSPHTEVAADVRGGLCSGYSVSALTSGVLGRGGDRNARSLERVLEVRGQVRVVGADNGILWGGVGVLTQRWLQMCEEDFAAGIQSQH